ncbi:MAG: hypothetical protein ABWX74_15670 [Aeromicrobium sp.]
MTIRTRFWLLAAIRWLSTGFIVPPGAVQGIVVLMLELPTGGFADAVGPAPRSA